MLALGTYGYGWVKISLKKVSFLPINIQLKWFLWWQWRSIIASKHVWLYNFNITILFLLVGSDLKRNESNSIVTVYIKTRLIFRDVVVSFKIVVVLVWTVMPVKLAHAVCSMRDMYISMDMAHRHRIVHHQVEWLEIVISRHGYMKLRY